MSIKVLIVGNTSDDHLRRFDRYMKEINKDKKIIIEAFNRNVQEKNNLFEKTYHIKNYFPRFFLKIKSAKIRSILHRVNYIISFSQVNHYDLINIHFLTEHSYYLLPFYKKRAKKIMISPWGSDVYRISTPQMKQKAKKIYDKADYISVPRIKFREDIKEIFSLSDKKIVDLGFGSENIDTLLNLGTITKKSSQTQLGLENSFIITCGYNRFKAHHHLSIIDALQSIKHLLPDNSVLFFPMTYGPEDCDYLRQIEQKLQDNNFRYKIFYEYMSSERITVIQKASDLFICIQDTDANSATLQEYLLCGADIILGSWLSYPQFEKYGTPFLTTPSIDQLKDILKKYFTNPQKNIVPEQLKTDIMNNAWSVKIKEWYNFYLSL